MRISRTVARCDRPSFNEGALHLARCERRHRLQVGNSALRSRNNKRWYRLLVRWSLEDEQNVVFARRQVVGDKLALNLGDEPANDLRTILGRRHHSVKAILREAGLCNKSRHVTLPVFTRASKQVAETPTLAEPVAPHCGGMFRRYELIAPVPSSTRRGPRNRR